MNESIILQGGHTENDSQKILKAGSLSMIYENGSLRQICHGSTELLRMIYMAVRDRAWLTPKPLITGEQIDIKENGFTIIYSARYSQNEIDFIAQFLIRGNADNSVEISFSGEALKSFEKNRIGFCVLHPLKEIAGEKCSIIHTDGTVEDSTFPTLISPHQPFRDISGMEWSPAGTKCSLMFEGDTFETEDQRNWTDASYKTYSTPLSLPYPVRVEKGWKTTQRIIFRAAPSSFLKSSTQNIVIDIDTSKTMPLPSIGVCKSTRAVPLTVNEARILSLIKFKHYRIELYLFDHDWEETAGVAVTEAKLLGYPLALALFFSEKSSEELSGLTSWLSGLDHPVAAVMIFHKDYRYTPDKLTDEVAPSISKTLPGVRIICGTNGNFAQLNRNRPASTNCKGFCWAVHPQEHASDNLTLVENLEGQYQTVKSARSFRKAISLWVSPVNLQRRFNANRSNYEIPAPNDSMPPQVDTRIMSLFGAGWTAGSLKYLSEAGADAVTYFETAGERGIIQGDHSPRWNEFPSEKGQIFPVYHLFRFLSEKNASSVIISKSSHPLLSESLMFTDGQNISGIIANLTSSVKEITIKGVDKVSGIKVFDSNEYRRFSHDPDWIIKTESILVKEQKLNLLPFSLNFIEF